MGEVEGCQRGSRVAVEWPAQAVDHALLPRREHRAGATQVAIGGGEHLGGTGVTHGGQGGPGTGEHLAGHQQIAAAI